MTWTAKQANRQTADICINTPDRKCAYKIFILWITM